MAPKSAGAKTGQRIKKEGKPENVHRIGGVDIQFDPALNIDQSKPTPLYPPYKVTPPTPLSEKEKRQVAHFKAVRDKIHSGPLYTILGVNVRVTKPGEQSKKQAATVNPFEGMPKYSNRYMKEKRMIPKLDTRPYNLQFFPRELWRTLDPTIIQTENGVIRSSKKHKPLMIPGFERNNEPDEEIAGEEGEEKAVKDGEEEDPLLGEAVDDNYDDDEDEGGDDYNAEQYFDDGGEGVGDDDGGGEDAGGGYMD